MNKEIHICLKEGGNSEEAMALSGRLLCEISDSLGEQLNILFDEKGISLVGFGMTYRGDFAEMLKRVNKGKLLHEMLVKAAKTNESGKKAIDATAGMGEDSFLLAAYGYDVTLFEQNPVVAALLRDALKRAEQNEELKPIVGRMHLQEGDSIEYLREHSPQVDVIYLDPMFPERQKSGLIGKKLQLIQKMEPPCGDEKELFDAVLSCKPEKIIVKRPLKSPFLAGKKPNHQLLGKAIRYDCYLGK